MWEDRGVLGGAMQRWVRSRAKAMTPKTLLKRLSFSDSAKSSILGHIFRRKGEKKANMYMGVALCKSFAILTILPKRQAPMDSESLRPPALLPFPQRCSSCNGLVVPPPPTASPGRGTLSRSAALGAPDCFATPWALG